MCQWTPAERAWEEILEAFMLQISSRYSPSVNYCAHVVPSAFFINALYSFILNASFHACWIIATVLLVMYSCEHVSIMGAWTSRFHDQIVFYS